MQKYYITLLISAFAMIGNIQSQFTLQDTLRGSITPERAWWDLTYYHLDIEVDPDARYIAGTNAIQYIAIGDQKRFQVDLQPPLKAIRFIQNGKELSFEHIGNAYFIDIPKVSKGETHTLMVHYEGNPPVSTNPPWTGGFTWKKDAQGNHFAATSCQGDGASMWWPCKDHMYDEPDSMLISVTLPDHLMNVSNGRLRAIETRKKGSKTYHWYVDNPINNYGVNVNIGDYAHFEEVYEGEKGKLDCDYYVLKENLSKAKEQFKQVPMMLEAFEYWFGPYPFYEDGFKLVEVPYLGMEHQSSVTYGNHYQNGYLGQDRSDSGWGMKFDFIIIHEAGHEWFANNITNIDIADMWIHEGFTAYSEALYLEYHYGKAAADAYNIGKRFRIRNDKPIIGTYNVNRSGSGDMYVKGANMLHTLRHWVDDDVKWRKMLRGLNTDFYHQTVTTEQIEVYMANVLGIPLDHFFDQYLRDTRIPILQYRKVGNKLWYRWSNCNKGFNMSIKVDIDNVETWLKPTYGWKKKEYASPVKSFTPDHNFYIASMEHQMYDE
jgi:aminopeptidase N